MDMSYCRFRNILDELQDCRDHIKDSKDEIGGEEACAREELIICCMGLLEDIGMVVNDSTSDYLLGTS